jgi:exo-beta-1,3-glucanase (GH17 family)
VALNFSINSLARIVVPATLLIIAFGLVVRASLDGQVVDLPKAPAEPINCVSYTPSGDGRIRHNLKVPRDVIAADLKVLAGQVRCVRTYTVGEGLDQVPDIARELGLRVMLGLWIGADPKHNAREIERGIELARAHTDVIDAVIVGNEVLLRRELSAEQLRTLIEQVRAGTSVPVTYADVWEFWLRNASLAESASFVTVHILPYWEDHPIGVEFAVDHVRSIYRKVQTELPGKRIFIGETGWPSEGRPRLQAVPSPINQARFTREFLVWAHSEHVPYNIIEAFDQPWKRIQEGTVGGFWGLYDAKAQQKFPLQSSLQTRTDWRLGPLTALLCAVLIVLFGWKAWPALGKEGFTWRAIALLGIAAHAAGSTLVAQWRYLIAANRSTLEWIATLTWTMCGWLAFGAICIALARWLDGKSPAPIPSIADILRTLGHGQVAPKSSSRRLGALRFAFLFGMAYVCLGLVYEGRGRDFPLALVGLPITGFALHSMIVAMSRTADSDSSRIDREEIFLGVILLLSAGLVLWIETLANLRAIGWCGLCVLFAVALFLPHTHRRLTQQHQPTEQQASAS